VPLAIGHALPIGSLGERLDHQILILFSPFAHPRVRADDRPDILDVLIFPGFVVKRRQWRQNSSDVEFGAAGDTYKDVGGKVQVQQTPYEI
jgi:hypothetical protein